MAGGLGSRFWPISNSDTPKQFIDVMGVGKSLLQMTFERFEKFCRREQIVIVTGEHYADQVREQIPSLEPHQVVVEPMRRNTAPCIAYASAIINQRDPEATIIVSPADHAIFKQDKFEADMLQAVDVVGSHDWIITLGAQPTKPETSYGYIQFREQASLENAKNLHKVVTFTEKPPVEMARQFIASGEFFWNAGIFVWRLPILMQAYRDFLPAIAETFFSLGIDTPHEDLERVYAHSEAISVDNGIMEKASNVHVMEAGFGWSDVETWDSLYDVSLRDSHGNAILGGNVFTYNTKNTIVTMPDEKGKTVVVEGLDGYIVAASDDTLMICRRSQEEMAFRFASDVALKELIDKK